MRIQTSSNPSKEQSIKASKIKNDADCWSFGFRYFRQIKNFGLNRVNAGWFVSVLERLQGLSTLNREAFLADSSLQGANRYHKIDWNARNVPIKREDFDWLDKEIITNEDEFEFLQFHVSKALGRVVGFWDENNIFQIILLDPFHNIQPSKYNGYKINDCQPLSCSYSSLIVDLDRIKNKRCNDQSCTVTKELSKIPSNSNSGNCIVAVLDDDFFDQYGVVCKSKSNTEIMEAGIIALMS